MNLNINELITSNTNIQKCRSIASKNRTYILNLNINDFAVVMSNLNPQSYGFYCADKIIKELCLTNSDDENKGDAKSITGKFIEIKGSLITSSNKNLNIVQVRPWQQINGYICYAWDVSNMHIGNNEYGIKLHHFYLSKLQMDKELNLLKATAAHGTKKANLDNANIEYRFSLPFDLGNNNFKRWVDNYLISLSDLKYKLNFL